MTHKMKMPVVGQRYLFCDEYIYMAGLDSREVEFLTAYTLENEYWYHCNEVKWVSRAHVGKLEKFWEHFKEIEDQPTVKENLTDNKVRVALNNLKQELSKESGHKVSVEDFYQLRTKSQNFLNALDDSNIPKKADCGELLGEHGAQIRKLGEKPPLGLRPKSIADQQRILEILEAMTGYCKEGLEIPSKWLEELNQRNVERIKKLEEK